MASIDWDEYKEFKVHSVKNDKLDIVIDFVKSYYNISNPSDMFDTLVNDDIGGMLLERKEITNAEGLENFMFRS